MSHNLQSPVPSKVLAPPIADEISIAIAEVEENERLVQPDLQDKARKSGISKPEFGHSYEEIKNLVLAKKHPVFSVALEEWDRKERVVSSRVDRREKRSADLINQIFNLVGFYSVFQGVVLTAVTQLLSAGKDCGSLCGKVWLPILLTLVAAVVTIIAVLEKFTNLKKLEESIFSERKIQGEAVKRGVTIRRQGLNFRFHHCKVLNYEQPRSFWKNKIGVIVLLIVFALIFVLAYLVILCDLWTIKRLQSGL